MPLVAPAPARAESTVRITTDFPDSWENAEDDHAAAATQAISQQRTASSIQFSKDAASKAYRLRTRWSDGDSEDEWIVMGCHVAERAGHRGLYIVGSESSTARDLSKSDFPELAWVDMSLYRGLKTYKGKPAFVFGVPFDQKRLTGDQARSWRSPNAPTPRPPLAGFSNQRSSRFVVYLDAATQLPILYNDGMSIRRYTFSQPTEDRLQPPAKIIDFLRVRNEALRIRLTPPPAPANPNRPTLPTNLTSAGPK